MPHGRDSDIASLVVSFKFDVYIRKKHIPEENFVPMFATAVIMLIGSLGRFFPSEHLLLIVERHLRLFGTTEYQNLSGSIMGRSLDYGSLRAQLFCAVEYELPPSRGTSVRLAELHDID